ncbi:MAG TPA: protein kinase [Candidatus Eisenbacteria bacterium]|nr:protein kinase [Candidatus Eisenbacteria bacterium]
MIGTTLSHYRVMTPLGTGGMGEVYLARDEHLDREVAVKVLQRGMLADPAARERFRREARVLARLSHPGVATIYDFGTHESVDFLVMEYVPGGTISARLASGPFSVPDVLRLGASIADALEEAHRRGFLHRDLKPGNVVLTADGAPKLLDFGLAGLLSAGTGQATELTQEGTVMGSLPYMAPEQLRGEPADLRSDVWALGALLYEMTTGRRAFEKARPEALMFEILHTMPRPVRTVRPDAPPTLERVVESCLDKDRARRPGSAGEVARMLRAVQSGAGGDSTTHHDPPTEISRDAIRSLAVLPFDNVSRDLAQEWFADGMTETLIADLARLQGLRVISRTSAMKYKGVARSLPEIGHELGVDAILEGSALLVGPRVRVTVRLVSARTDETLWSQRYDDKLEDVLDVQSKVAAAVVKEIELHLAPHEVKRFARRQTVKPEAHLEYLKGLHTIAGTSPQAVEVSLRHFRRALEIDPSYAPAWAGIADCHSIRASRGMAPPAEATHEAEDAALKALTLDDSVANAHSILGTVRLHQLDFAGAIRELKRAIELNPGLADAYQILGRVLYCTEQHTDAQAAMLEALRLDPMSMIIHTSVGDAYYYAREFERSVVYYRKAIELDPRFDGAHTDLARSLEALGRFDESRKEYEEGRLLSGGVAGPSFGLAHLAASRGDTAEARRMLAELTEARSRRVVSAWGLGALHASLGDIDEAFGWLETAVKEQATGLAFLRVHPRIDSIRHDPRYGELVRRLNLHAV